MTKEVEDRTLKRILALREEGLGVSAIARALEAEGFLTATGKPQWHRGTVGNILQRHDAQVGRRGDSGGDRVAVQEELLETQRQLVHVRRERDELRAELAKYTVPAADLKVGRWNIQKGGRYYRAFRKVGGKLIGVYLGKQFDETAAREKIMAKHPDIGID